MISNFISVHELNGSFEYTQVATKIFLKPNVFCKFTINFCCFKILTQHASEIKKLFCREKSNA